MLSRSVSRHKARKKLSEVRALILTRELLEDIQKYVFVQRHVEACGFLSGKFDGAEAKVERVIFVKNISGAAERFVLDPRECDQVFEDVRGDEELVGFFHSHAKDPQPSSLDKVNMRFLPLVWLIIGRTEEGWTDECECFASKTHRRETRPVEVRVVETKC